MNYLDQLLLVFMGKCIDEISVELKRGCWIAEWLIREWGWIHFMSFTNDFGKFIKLCPLPFVNLPEIKVIIIQTVFS